MTTTYKAFEAYLDHLDKKGIKYELDETARNVLEAMRGHINKTNLRRNLLGVESSVHERENNGKQH